MSNDIASLSFAIDSSQTVTALDALTRLQERASTVADQSRRLGRESETTGVAIGKLDGSARGLASSLGDVSSAFAQALPNLQRAESVFESLARRLAEDKKALDGSALGVEGLVRVNREAEALGKAFGQGADGLIAFVNRASEMRLAADVTASSLDRITRALENQTAAGAAVRAVLKEYGVEVEKFRIDQPDRVLGAFVDRVRGYRDTPAKTRDIQAVMGPLGADDLNTVLNQGYVPLEERQKRERASAASADVSRILSETDFRTRQREREMAELADLRGRYVTPERGTQSETLAELRRIHALPEEQRQESYGEVYRVRTAVNQSAVGRWMSFADSGRYSANQIANLEQTEREKFEGQGPFLLPSGWGGDALGRARAHLAALPGYYAREAMNVFGMYEPPTGADQRPEDPYAQNRRELTLASQLASYGDVGFMGVAASRQRALRMEREGGRDAFRQAYGGEGPTDAQAKELEAARADVAAQTRRWGPYDESQPTPPPLLVARDRARNAEAVTAPLMARQRDADQRFDNLSEINRTFERYALRPEERINDSTSRARFLTGLEASDRGFAGYVMQQAGQLNVPTTRMENYRDGADFLARGGFSPGAQQAITQGFEQQADDRASERNRGLQEQIDLQTRLREASAQGAGAVDQARVTWAAYNAEFKASGDASRSWSAAEVARQDLLQKNLTLVERNIDQMREETAALTRRNDAAEGLGEPPARRAAQMEADIASRARAADMATPGTGAGDRTAEQERDRLAQQARAAGNEIVATAREQLRVETQIAAAAGERASVLEQIRRGQQVDQQFQEAMAQAIASKDQERIRSLEQQVRLTKEMREQIAAIQQLTSLTQQLRVMGDQSMGAARADYYVAGLPRADRGDARAELPAYRVAAEQFAGREAQRLLERYQGLPAELRDHVERRIASLDAPMQQGVRGTFGAEVGGQGQRAFNNPGQITPPAYDEVQRDRAARGVAPLMPLDQLRNRDNWQANVDASIEYMELLRRQGGGSAAYAIGGYGPDGQAGLRTFLRSGNTEVLTPEQIRRIALTGAAPEPYDMRNRFSGRLTDEGAAAVSAASIEAANRREVEARIAREAYGDQAEIRNPYLALVRRGETGRAQLLQAGVAVATAQRDKDPAAEERARQAQEGISFGFRADFVGRLGQADREIEFQGLLAEAYGKSSAAVQEVTVAYQAQQEAKRLALSAGERELLQEKMLQEARARTATQVAGDTKQARSQGQLYEADASIPWWAGPQARGMTRAKAQADQYIQDRGIQGTPEADSYRQAVEFRETQRAIADDQQRLRDGFLQMGQAAQSAFADAVLGGKNLQGVIGGLLQDWARLMLQMASRQAFNFLGDIAMKGLNLFGGGSFMPTSVQIPGASIPMASAAGNVFDQGQHVAMLAAGDVVDRPTMFQLAQGRRALVGEAGRPEGVFPLTRNAQGELAVQVLSEPGGGARQRPALALGRMPNGDLAVRMPQEAPDAVLARSQQMVGMPGRLPMAMLAAGGVVEAGQVSPATFASAAAMRGQPAEAMPLPRAVPVVAEAGGASGRGAMRDLQVVNNIRIDGSTVGKDGVGPQAQQALTAQIERATRSAVLALLAEEKRPGGLLFGS